MESPCRERGWEECYGHSHVLEMSQWTQGGQREGVTWPSHSGSGSGSDIGESHIRGRKSRKGGKGSSQLCIRGLLQSG